MRSILAVGVTLAISACSDSNWTAFVYPDIENIPNADQVQNFTIGNYKTFEECQEAAIGRMRSNYATTGKQGDYQCGLNCSHRDELGGLLICKETRK